MNAVQHARYGRPAGPDTPRAGSGNPHLSMRRTRAHRLLTVLRFPLRVRRMDGYGTHQGSAAIPRPPLPVPDRPFGAKASLSNWPGASASGAFSVIE